MQVVYAPLSSWILSSGLEGGMQLLLNEYQDWVLGQSQAPIKAAKGSQRSQVPKAEMDSPFAVASLTLAVRSHISIQNHALAS